jgi:hypothetical protein
MIIFIVVWAVFFFVQGRVSLSGSNSPSSCLKALGFQASASLDIAVL